MRLNTQTAAAATPSTSVPGVWSRYPSASVRDGVFTARTLGAWTGTEYQKTVGLVFIAPRSGVYRVAGSARTKPWEGGATVFRLGILKKDTQRAAAVALDLAVELTAGHELVFVPLMPDWNNATATTIANLVITAVPGDAGPAAAPKPPARPQPADKPAG